MYKYLYAVIIICLAHSAQAQLFGVIPINSFEKGYYYDLKDQKISGKIAKDASSRNIFADGNYILFKADTATQRIKLTPKMVKSFVIGTDSFTVSHDGVPQFFKVLIDHQTLKLFSVSQFNNSVGVSTGTQTGTGLVSGGSISKQTTYLYGPDVDHIAVMGRNNFIEVMCQLMADEPIIVQQIKDKFYRPGDMNDLLAYYNKVKQREAEIAKRPLKAN